MKSMEETFNEWWVEKVKQNPILDGQDDIREFCFEAWKDGWDDGYDALHWHD